MAVRERHHQRSNAYDPRKDQHGYDICKNTNVTPITVNVTTAGNSNVNSTENYMRKKGNIGHMPSNVEQPVAKLI